ncbi:MAG: hypothetical protein ACE5EA_06435 [Nitrospirota bacterium]
MNRLFKKKLLLSLLFLSLSLFLFIGERTVFAFTFNGFGDIRYRKSNDGTDTTEGNDGNFALGQLDLYASEDISDRLSILVELVVESDEQGEWVIDGERMEVGYLFSDALTIRAGRFHNLLGFWNHAYHHGAHLQTTIDRPEFLEFEDEAGILPTHIVGLWAKGKTEILPFVLNYGFMVGNGSRLKSVKDDQGNIVGAVLDPNNVTDNNRDKSVSVNLMLRPVQSIGNGFGIFGNISQVEENETGINIDQLISGAYFFYTALPFEFISEYYKIRDEDNNKNNDYSSSAYYIQGGYNIGRAKPYIRYENLSVKEDDPYFNALGTEDNTRIVGGVRLNLAIKSSLKIEVRGIDEQDKDNKFTEYAVQWSFAF